MELVNVKMNERKQPHPYGRTSEFRSYNAKPRIYFDFKGETIIDDLNNRHSRSHVELKKMIAPALRQLGLDENVSVKWRQTAGCQCGCSPGFIVDTNNFPNSHVDLWITVK